MALTAMAFALDIRNMRPSRTPSGWLTPPFLGLHVWPMITANVLIYGYICWLGFWFIRGTAGRERVFMAGWFLGILLWPVKMLWPQWAGTVRQIGVFGLAVALLAALALLLDRSDAAGSNSATDAT